MLKINSIYRWKKHMLNQRDLEKNMVYFVVVKKNTMNVTIRYLSGSGELKSYTRDLLSDDHISLVS